jgi:hypothetical protein
VWDKRYLKVLAGLRESKERAFRGSAMVRDKERAAAAERWITQCEASYEDEHKKLDDMVGRVLKSGNPFLVKAVSGRKGDTYFGGRLIEAYVAVFSRDPTEVFYGADKVPYPVANPDDGVPTFPYPFDDVPNPLR